MEDAKETIENMQYEQELLEDELQEISDGIETLELQYKQALKTASKKRSKIRKIKKEIDRLTNC